MFGGLNYWCTGRFDGRVQVGRGDERGGLIMSHMEPGDLLLWDSRILHCSSPGVDPAKPGAPTELTRMVSLVCMMPRELSSPEVLQWRKNEAVPNLIGTTNWTDRVVNADDFPNIKAVAERDAARGIRKPPSPLPKLSRAQLELVGFTPEEITTKSKL